MHACPNCKEKCISTWQKLNTGSLHPKRCKRCGKRYHLSGWGILSFMLSCEFLFWSSIAIALILNSWFGLLIFPVGVFLSCYVFSKVLKLHPTTDKEINRARIIAAFLAVGLILFAVIMEN